MAKSLDPTPPANHITPQMVNDAKRALGACHQAADKIRTFSLASYDFPEQAAINDDIRMKAEGLIAAYEMQQGLV